MRVGGGGWLRSEPSYKHRNELRSSFTAHVRNFVTCIGRATLERIFNRSSFNYDLNIQFLPHREHNISALQSRNTRIYCVARMPRVAVLMEVQLKYFDRHGEVATLPDWPQQLTCFSPLLPKSDKLRNRSLHLTQQRPLSSLCLCFSLCRVSP
jgi:hypothetical protein